MTKTINQTENGKIFKCSDCNQIHIEFKNLNFNFNEDEFKKFAHYFSELDGQYWESMNVNVQFRKKIIIPIGHKNLNILLNNEELQELKFLFSKSSVYYLNLLTQFNYKLHNN